MTREKFLQYQTSAEHRDAIKYLAEASEDDDVRITARPLCLRLPNKDIIIVYAICFSSALTFEMETELVP